MTADKKHIVIAGGGIIGLATAWRLLHADCSMTVLDDAPGSGASCAAAGMLAPVSEVVWDQPTLYPLMIESGAMYSEFAAAIADESGMDVGYLPQGTLVCAGDAADRQYLTELLRLQHQMGMTIDSITSGQARQLETALGPGCVGAVSIPGDHQVDPRKLVKALLALLGERVVPARAEEVLTEGGRVGIRASDGQVYYADHVHCAAGLGTPQIQGLPNDLELPLRPVWGEVLRMAVPTHLQPLVTRTIRGIVHGRPVYIVPRADGTVVLGATSREDDSAGVSAEGVYQLLRDAHHLLPGILDCEITEITCRARPGSPDDVPMIGRVAPGVSVSTGYFRHGILLAALGSQLGSDVILGRELDAAIAAAVDPWRFSKR